MSEPDLIAGPGEREHIMASVAHLVPRKQQEIERAVRLLRAFFVDRRPRAPRRGTLHRLMLVGAYAQRGDKPDRETGEINAYAIWAFVDHPAYRGLNRHWGRARGVVADELRGRATIRLSVFTNDEIDRLRAVGNRFLTDQHDGGVVLYDRSDDTAGGRGHGRL